MKLACIGDVHANHRAFDAALADARAKRADALVLLGDYCTDLPHPEESVARLKAAAREFPCTVLRGNRDEYLLGHRAGESPFWRDGTQFGSLLYTYEHISAETLDFFDSLPIAAQIPLGPEPVAACHASPSGSREWIFDDEARMRASLGRTAARLLIAGHTHLQKRVSIGAQTLLFAGSAGMAIGCPGQAQYLMLTEENGRFMPEFCAVPYDAEATMKELENSSIYRRAALWAKAVKILLLTGRNATSDLVSRTLFLARQAGPIPKEGIPETVWEAAARDLGILCV